MERLQKVIASMGVCSRRHAEELILAGRVKVNNEVVTKLGTTVDADALIFVDDKQLKREQKVYYVLNKPKNCVTTVSDTRNRSTVMDCFAQIQARIYPVGRLDFDTTGVLLFTNDGELTNLLLHPRYQTNKTYRVTLKGQIEDKELTTLKTGVLLEDGMTAPAEVGIIKYDPIRLQTIIELTIHEGKNHQIKRMFQAIGYEVKKLDRISFNGITKEGLKEGQYRPLTTLEVMHLKKGD